MSATGRGTKRNAYDFYSTPKHCTEAILKQLVFPSDARVLEPCCGDGAIWRVIEHVPWVAAIGWCEITKGRDFLAYDFQGERFDMVITNPPFSLAQEFIEKSLTLANCTVMLLRLNFLGAQKRRDWWRKNAPTAIHVLSDRPKFGLNKHGKLGGDATEYAWFVWDSTGRQKRGIYWL